MSELKEKLLDAALKEVKKSGYTGASINDILKEAGGKKGSLYHHFGSKKDLILQMIEQRVNNELKDEWITLEQNDTNHLDDLIHLIQDSSQRDCINGCVLGTLMQELSYEDEDFNKALNTSLDLWQEVFYTKLKKAQEKEEIKAEVNIDELSTFLMAILQGAMLVTKMQGNDTRYNKSINQVVHYLNSIRT